ncbi:hypothetical protein L9F63_006918 [Diploptera punctata]|uniref:Peptidase S1 domain-containing protein n=1 Tax=Diploptera punctata TaxID=6984 RepID=A0AAD7Z8P0_DIPPU|nr:hypothetical protein L9F63_006918 [Diploptera punctata]
MGCSSYLWLVSILVLLNTPSLDCQHQNGDDYIHYDTPSLQHPPSPCPGVFSYEGREAEKDKWFGVILVTTDAVLKGLRLDIILDSPAQLIGNWIGDVSSSSNIHFTILNLNMTVNPGPPTSVRIFAKFQHGGEVPRLQSIQLNGREICPEHGIPPIVTKPITTRRPTSPPTVRPIYTVDAITRTVPVTSTPNPSSTDVYRGCGRTTEQPTPLITGGQGTSRGQFPWHAALYQSKDIHLKYTCGGSLIGARVILTAAHCVTKHSSNYPMNPDLFLVYLGKYHLKVWSEGGVQVKQIVEIIVHPKYNSSNFQADLAILLLSSPAEYTVFVRPVCLWDRQQTDLSYVIGKEGTVPGWGLDETGQISEDLMMTKMPVVSQQTCLWSNKDFFPSFTSNTTFCAGYRNGSVCNGDSGGGMVFSRKIDGSTVWMLRGIVSLSKSKENQATCDVSNYVVFTDAAKYLDWINKLTK